MMFIKIFFICFLMNIWHCQGKENLLTNDEFFNPHLSSVLENQLTTEKTFPANNGLIFTHIPTSNQFVNYPTTFGGKFLENSDGHSQLNYFIPNNQLLSRNQASVYANTLIENSYHTFQRKSPLSSYPINPIPSFLLPPKPTPGPPFFPQQKYSQSYLTLYPKPYLRPISEYIILRVNPRSIFKPSFNNINSQRDGPNQALRNEYFHRTLIPNFQIYQKQDVINSEQILKNKFIEFNNQAFTGNPNSVYSSSVYPFLMKIIQSNYRNNRAKKHVNFYPHSNLVFTNNSSTENCLGCGSSIYVHSTPKPESVYTRINLTSNTKNRMSKSHEPVMIFDMIVKNVLSAQNNSTFDEGTRMNPKNINSTDEILVSTERISSTTLNSSYDQKIPVDNISNIYNKTNEIKSSTEIVIVFEKNSTPD